MRASSTSRSSATGPKAAEARLSCANVGVPTRKFIMDKFLMHIALSYCTACAWSAECQGIRSSSSESAAPIVCPIELLGASCTHSPAKSATACGKKMRTPMRRTVASTESVPPMLIAEGVVSSGMTCSSSSRPGNSIRSSCNQAMHAELHGALNRPTAGPQGFAPLVGYRALSPAQGSGSD